MTIIFKNGVPLFRGGLPAMHSNCCCDEGTTGPCNDCPDPNSMPLTITLVIAGFSNGTFCTGCAGINATYVLNSLDTSGFPCCYYYASTSAACTDGYVNITACFKDWDTANPVFEVTMVVGGNMGDATFVYRKTFTGTGPRNCGGHALSGESIPFISATNAFHCSGGSSTATVTT